MILFERYLYRGVTPQRFGFPRNPDQPPYHTVQMTEGLLYGIIVFSRLHTGHTGAVTGTNNDMKQFTQTL